MNIIKAFKLLLPVLVFSCGKNSTVIKIKGSDTEVNLTATIAEQFYKVNSEYTIAVSGGGSGLGIASLLNGQADIANSSRPLTFEEKELFEKKGISLKTIIFAEDATAFVVHVSNLIDSIWSSELAKIFSGEYSNWSEVTNSNKTITLYGRQSNSGTHSFIQSRLNIQYSRFAKEMNGNAQILEAIKQDATGIGYVGAGYLLNGSASRQKVKILKIIGNPGEKAISPLDSAAIMENKYFFQRPLYQFVPVRSWQKVNPLIAYERSAAGKKLIEKEGYYNLNSSTIDENQ